MNGNAVAGNKLIRMELEFKGHSYSFNINPENYDIKLQNRMNLVYTKGGAFIDLFGEGVKEISISGTTGLSGQSGDQNEGFNKIKELKSMIEENFNNIQDGAPVEDFLNFYNHTDGEAYVTVPVRFNVLRNVNQPLLYKFDLFLYAIRKVGEPAPTNDIQMVGNPLDVPTTGVETLLDRDVVETDKNSSFTNKALTYTKAVRGSTISTPCNASRRPISTCSKYVSVRRF